MSGGISATTIIAGASLAATAAGTVMSAIGSSNQSSGQAAAMRAQGDAQQRQAQAAQYQSQVALNSKKVAEWQAADALKRGQVAEEQRRTKTKLQIGAQRAAMGSMGADVGSGSSIDIVGDTAAVGEQDALTIRNNSARDSWERKTVAANYQSQADMANFGAGGFMQQSNNSYNSAASYDSNSWIGVGANLIGGASSVADKWSTYKTKGIF